MKPTAKFWEHHALAAERGAQSTGAYAKRHGLAVSTLYYWRSKLRAATRTSEASSPAGKFVALRIAEATVTTRPTHCTLVLPAGIRLEMSALPAPEWLAALGQAAQGTR